MKIDPIPDCNPDAPTHGFARHASHNMGRYVCECEFWELEQSSHASVAKTSEPTCAPREDFPLLEQDVIKVRDTNAK